MKHLISFTFFFLFVSLSNGQNINVKSFRLLENDLDARVNYPKRDQNNEVCAIIKVVTTQTGFTFDVGSLGVVATEQKAGEIWVYVPRGVQRITISHSQLGVLRNHPLNIPIQAATVYELVLTTARVTTTVEEPEIESQWLIITSKPEGANVFIDDMLVGTTPFQRRYRESEYNYRVELPRYHTQAGRISLKGDRQRIDLTLKPNFGDIRVTSTPENGMAIYLNDNNTGKTTPATIEGIASGENTVKLIDSWYQPQAKRVTVNDEKTTTVIFQMQPAFANVTINAKPSANILIDDVQKGNTRWNGRLMEGVYSIIIEKDKHYPQTRKLEIFSGKDQSFDFELKPKTGTVNISTIPIDANISIDVKNYGKTPLTIKDLLVGDYNLTIEKTGYGSVNRKITITENKELDIKETLPTGLEVTFETTPSGAELYINNQYQGLTPEKISLEFGNHNIKLVNNSRIVEETINIRQGGKSRWSFDVIDGRDITITSEPSRASLYINGKYEGLTPKTLLLEYGTHNIKLVNASKTFEERISVTKYSKTTWKFDVSVGKSINLRSKPSGAKLTINGIHRGTTPTWVFLEYGNHNVLLEHSGKTISKTVRITKNSGSFDDTNIFDCGENFTLSSIPSDADLYVDGKFIGKTPINYLLKEKSATVKLKKKGYKNLKREIDCRTYPSGLRLTMTPKKTLNDYYDDAIGSRVSFGFPIGILGMQLIKNSDSYNFYGQYSYTLGAHINYRIFNWLYLKNEVSYAGKFSRYGWMYDEREYFYSNYFNYQPGIVIIFKPELDGYGNAEGWYCDVGLLKTELFKGDDLFRKKLEGWYTNIGYCGITGGSIYLGYKRYNNSFINWSNESDSEIFLGFSISF